MTIQEWARAKLVEIAEIESQEIFVRNEAGAVDLLPPPALGDLKRKLQELCANG